MDIEDVYFSYVPDKKLIEDFNLHVKPGQRVAIVGPTGCGKTTIINLLMRFYDVNSGTIKVSGHDIRKITRESLRDNYGMVLQETWLKKGTIRDNIIMGKPDATDEEIIAAAKASHAHSFIRRLPKGYDTEIGEDGGSLSQGQPPVQQPVPIYTPDEGVTTVHSVPSRKNAQPDDDIQDTEVYVEETLSLDEVEKDMIKRALAKHGGKRRGAAADLNISERTLYRKIKEYNLE